MKGRKFFAYELRSYDGTITKEYKTYSGARKAASKLIKKDIMCEIMGLTVDKDSNGTDDLSTLRWIQIIGC